MIMIEVQDIFAALGYKYCDEHNIPFQLRKTMMNIITCRTAELGGHVDECDNCGHTSISYNSSRANLKGIESFYSLEYKN